MIQMILFQSLLGVGHLVCFYLVSSVWLQILNAGHAGRLRDTNRMAGIIDAERDTDDDDPKTVRKRKRKPKQKQTESDEADNNYDGFSGNSDSTAQSGDSSVEITNEEVSQLY